MKKIHSIIVLVFFCTSFLFAQDNKYDLMLSSGTVHPIANALRISNQTVLHSEIVNGTYFRILQFNDIPSDEEKNDLKNNGITLINYLPNYAYFVSINEKANLNTINKHGNIRALLPILPEYKIHESIKENKLPADAKVVKGKADLIITYFAGIPLAVIKKLLQQEIRGAKVLESDEASQTVKIRVKKKLMSKVPTLSFVQFVEPARQWVIENNSGTTLHRSNTINTYISGGLRYDGTGVGVSIGDGGAYFAHMDFKGRQTGGATNGGADHGTHVAGILAGAGNLDPRYRGQAPGANLVYSDGFNDISSVSAITALYNGTNKIRVTNHSLGETENAGYTTNARQSDLQVESLPSIFNVHSCGNSGSGWNTITGGYKAAKNSIATGNLDYKDVIASSSSRGPSKDGRIKPDICSKGSAVQSTMPNNAYGSMTGTSMASPGMAGCVAQLISTYRSLNGGNDPSLAELKCVMLNTAEDLGSIGPDYTYGWGRINVWKAYNILKDKRTVSGSIVNGATNTHAITVPTDVSQLRVMTYWADPAASVGVSKALINDLDITVTDASQTYNPWNLTPTSPGNAATKGADHDNNMEQVVIDNPAAGTYSLNIKGNQVPQGPQTYWVCYEFIKDEIKVTYPIGGEGFVPGETEYVRWDASNGTGNFTVEYSTDGGSTWTNITSSAGATARFYAWTVPSKLTGEARVRVTRSGKSSTSDANFSIINVPGSLKVDWRCTSIFQLSWSAVSGATEYEVYLLGAKYMESQGKTSGTNFVVNAPNTSIQWTSVRALASNGQVIGRRALAISVATTVVGCLVPVEEVSETPYSFSVYPNPVSESTVVSINLSESDNLNIKLIDMCGKEVAQILQPERLPAGQHSFNLNAASYAPGLYFVSLNGSKGVAYKKVVITAD